MNAEASWLRPTTAAAEHPEQTELQGSHCRTTQDLFTRWAEALGFPDYFGRNWDAFEDCMRTTVESPPSRIPAPAPTAPLVVVLRDADQLLADEPTQELRIFLDILDDLRGTTDKDRRPLHLLLDDTPDHLSHLARRISDAGHTLPLP